jgi:hypothetical protein
MLKLKHPTLIGLYVCYVLLTVFGSLNNFLPILWKLFLPSPVPWGFVLQPRVTEFTWSMSPVPHPYLSAPCDHRVTATRTRA